MLSLHRDLQWLYRCRGGYAIYTLVWNSCWGTVACCVVTTTRTHIHLCSQLPSPHSRVAQPPSKCLLVPQAMPQPDSAMFYFKTNKLGFDAEFFGRVKLVAALADLAGGRGSEGGGGCYWGS
jgi:hypothetical protein